MSDSRFRWHFPSTDGGDEDGINDPLRETFEGDHERFVARESIQNSLDARKDDTQPVLVRFERLNLPVAHLPGLSGLKDMLQKAKDYSSNQEKSLAFYGAALELLGRDKVSVLKISDFNTIGLNGSDDDTGGGWYKLTRGVGVNSMSGVGGGSFGIGKGAPFAASELRAVFYSTINEDNEPVFKGKVRLSSFRNDDGDVKRGIGDYGLENGRSVGSIRNLDDIPELFRRIEQGTDIYIIGYQTEESDWTKLLLNSLLNNFWAAIHFNELDVELLDNGELLHRVSEENLEEYMNEYAGGKDDSVNFYLAVKEPTKRIDAELPLLKKVSLFVKTGESYPKAVQMMRKSKMVVYSIGNYRVLPEPYAAVFICESDEGNRLLRDLEPPAHDTWDAERNKPLGKKVSKEYLDFIRNSLRDMADDKDTEPEDIPELSKWLPEDDEERDDKNPYLGGEPTDERSTTETAREIGAERGITDTKVNPIRQREVPMVQTSDAGEKEPKTPPNPEPGHGGGGDVTVDPSTEGNIPHIDVASIRFRARELRKDGDRIYQAVITSSIAQSGSLRLMAIGDDQSYPIDIASVVDEHEQAVNFDGSTIKDLSLEGNQPTKLFISLKHKKRYALGVE